jgi:hypothetical protein
MAQARQKASSSVSYRARLTGQSRNRTIRGWARRIHQQKILFHSLIFVKKFYMPDLLRFSKKFLKRKQSSWRACCLRSSKNAFLGDTSKFGAYILEPNQNIRQTRKLYLLFESLWSISQFHKIIFWENLLKKWIRLYA